MRLLVVIAVKRKESTALYELPLFCSHKICGIGRIFFYLNLARNATMPKKY